jgi:hypothetical protein
MQQKTEKKKISKAEFERLCREACTESILQNKDEDQMICAICKKVYEYLEQDSGRVWDLPDSSGKDCRYELDMEITVGDRLSESFNWIKLAKTFIDEALVKT